MKHIIGTVALVAILACGGGQDTSQLSSAVEGEPCLLIEDCMNENPCDYSYCAFQQDEETGICMHSEGNVVPGCCWAPPVDPVTGKVWSQEERTFHANSQCNDKCACSAPDLCDQDLAECKAGPLAPGCSCEQGAGGCEADEDCVEDGNICNGVLSGKCGTQFPHQCDWLTGPVGWNCDGYALGTCKTHACKSETGLCENLNLAESTPCWDYDPCTVDDQCDGDGNCVGTIIPDCLLEVSEDAPDEALESQPEVVAEELVATDEEIEPLVELVEKTVDASDEREPLSLDEGTIDAGETSGSGCSLHGPDTQPSALPILLLTVFMVAILNRLAPVTRRGP